MLKCLSKSENLLIILHLLCFTISGMIILIFSLNNFAGRRSRSKFGYCHSEWSGKFKICFLSYVLKSVPEKLQDCRKYTQYYTYAKNIKYSMFFL